MRHFEWRLSVPWHPAVAIEELVILCQCSDYAEWKNLIAFLPL